MKLTKIIISIISIISIFFIFFFVIFFNKYFYIRLHTYKTDDRQFEVFKELHLIQVIRVILFHTNTFLETFCHCVHLRHLG